MEFSEVIRRRRMVRRYSAEPVGEAQVERILAAALSAPSAGNAQGQSFVVVTEPDRRRRIAELAGEPAFLERGFEPWLSSAPVLVVVCVSEARYRERYAEPDKLGPDRPLDWPVPYWWVDGGAALMALLLAAVDERLAAGFLGSHAVPGLRAEIGLPDEVVPLGVVTVGHPGRDRRSASLDRGRRPRLETVHRETWSGKHSGGVTATGAGGLL